MGDGRGTGLPPADTSSHRELAQDGEMPSEVSVWFEAGMPGSWGGDWWSPGSCRGVLARWWGPQRLSPFEGVMAPCPVPLKVAIREGSQRAQHRTDWDASPTSCQASDHEPQFLRLSSGANINLYQLPDGGRP